MATLIGAPGIERTSQSFRKKLIESANRLGMNPDHLATVISFETGGTFSPSVRNPLSGCVGLIQFCRTAAVAAAKAAGKTLGPEEALNWLGAMSGEEQLDHVVGYFLSVGKGRSGLTLEQAYLLVFAPGFAFSSPSSTAYAVGTEAYAKNKGMDTDGDGKITVADIARKITSRFKEGEARPRVDVEGVVATVAGVAGEARSRTGLVVGVGFALGWYVLSEYLKSRKG